MTSVLLDIHNSPISPGDYISINDLSRHAIARILSHTEFETYVNTNKLACIPEHEYVPIQIVQSCHRYYSTGEVCTISYNTEFCPSWDKVLTELNLTLLTDTEVTFKLLQDNP
jgi:hypothetical protein